MAPQKSLNVKETQLNLLLFFNYKNKYDYGVQRMNYII